MKPVLLPVAYLPPVSWMAVAFQSECIVLEINETYPKQTYRNRCSIATSSGILSLTVPVKRANGNHTKTCDIQIDNSKNWQQLHWRSILTAYNKTPYFLFYRDIFEPVFFRKYELLMELNRDILRCIFKVMKRRNIEIIYTNEYISKPDFHDLRNSFHPKTNPHEGIALTLPRYMQAFEENHGYLPDLSIIDLLFNLGPEALKYLANVELSLKE